MRTGPPSYELGRIDEATLAFSRRAVGSAPPTTGCRPTAANAEPEAVLGRCPKEPPAVHADGDGGLNFLCEGLKAFYARVERATCQPSGSASDDDDAEGDLTPDPARSVPQDPARPRAST